MGVWDTITKVGSAVFPAFALGNLAQVAQPALDYMGMKQEQKQYEESNALQKEFAQNGIRWKVADAKAAGLHPLAALGSQTSSYQPVYNDVAGTFRNMGQDISRSIMALTTDKEREAHMLKLAETRGELENDLLRAQIANIMSGLGPPLPSGSGIPDSLRGFNTSGSNGGNNGPYGFVYENPLSVTATEPNQMGKEVGAVPAYTFTRNSDGSMSPVPSMDAKNRIEDQIIPEVMWAWRNLILPNFGGGPPKPSKDYLPQGEGYKDWEWSYTKQAYVPVKHEGRNTPSLYELFIKAPGGGPDRRKVVIRPPRFLDRSGKRP